MVQIQTGHRKCTAAGKVAARCYVIIVYCLAGLLASCNKINVDEPEPQKSVIIFTQKSGSFAQTQLLWQEGRLNSEEEPEAIVLYLHGGSSKGSDNKKQMNEKAVTVIKDYLISKGINACFVVPQCPSALSWGGKMNEPIQKLLSSYGCSKIYAFGGSMGGTGIGNLASSYPELFTAIMLVAWNPTMSDAVTMSRIPTYTVMGSADELMDSGKVAAFIESVKANGGTARMDIEQGWEHSDVCEQSYTEVRLNWVFSF